MSVFFSYSQGERDTIIFSRNSGLFNESFTLTLSNNGENKIYYSLNGDYPKVEYKGPITISKSVTVRVKNKDLLQGYTRNYIISKRKISLPIVCITIKPSDLYDPITGLYVKGTGASDVAPYLGANFHKNWERVCYVELIDTNNEVQFNQKFGLKIFGQFSAMLPQKSFSIHARKKYGNKRLKYQLFPDLPFKKYKSFILRNSGSDNCVTHFRDVMMTSLVKDFNLDVQAYKPCVVYLNGKYWGIYYLREKINEHFIRQHHLVNKDSIAILKHRYDVQKYGRINYKSMLSFIKKTDFSVDSNITRLSKLMDIDNYLDYNIAQIYFNNIDAGGNIRYWRERRKGSKWHWILYDTDFGFGLRKGNGVDENTLKRFTEYSSESWPVPAWSTLIIRKLLENDSIKNEYIRKFSYYLNTTFKSTNVLKHIDFVSGKIKDEIPFHLDKWKKNSNWNKKIILVKDFASRRPEFMFSFMVKKFNLDTTYSLNVTYNKEHGKVYFDNYLVDSGYNGIYFANVSYPISVNPVFGYKFKNWSGNSLLKNDSFKLNSDSTLVANFIRKGKSSFHQKVIINEVCYKDSLLSDYIELFNSTDSIIDLSHWAIKGENKIYYIKDGIVLKPNSYFTFFKKSTNSNTKVLNSEIGLFNINKNSRLELYSKDEKMVDSIYLSNEIFNKNKTTERVSNFLEEKWVSTESNSINKINSKQVENENLQIVIGVVFVLLILIFVILLIVFRKRKKRLHSSIE